MSLTRAAFFSALLTLSGCSGGTEAPKPRHHFTLDELSIQVGDTVRSFFLSDKKGGFLTGRVGARVVFSPSWSVDGEVILRAADVLVEDTLLDASRVHGAVVRPDRVEMDFGFGRAAWAPLEGLPELTWGVTICLQADRDVRALLGFTPGERFAEVGREGGISWQDGGGRVLTLCGGAEATGTDRGLEFRSGREHRVMLLMGYSRVPADELMSLHSRLAELMGRRTERMEEILERSYLRLSDSLMTRALAWARLSVDAMVVERAETLAVSSLPWDGTYDGRSNLQSLAGMALISGEYSTAAGLLRSWGATQDSSKRHTAGRIASCLHGSPPEYEGVDVGAWFVRGLYDYALVTNDTATVQKLFPVVRRSIEGMLRNNVNGKHLVVHRADETWMGRARFEGSRGPYAAVEVQTLWQYQQMIGCILAQSRGDSALAKAWGRGAAGTAAEFARAFIDTGRYIVYDYLDGEGRGVDILRPNGMLALDAIEGERIQQALLTRSVRGLLYSRGPAMLEGESGTVVPWLAGPFAYGLTRADRQDLAYRVSRVLAERILGAGMVGTVPEVLPSGDDGARLERETFHGASLLGTSEFLRAMVQDFLGVHVDAPSSVIRCAPKLPAEIRSADFTVYMGAHPVRGSYQRIGETGRMNLSLSDVPRPVKWRFIWVFETGDAWIGAIRLPPGSSATAVFMPDGLLVYQGGEEKKPEESWFVRGFVRSKELGELSMAEEASAP